MYHLQINGRLVQIVDDSEIDKTGNPLGTLQRIREGFARVHGCKVIDVKVIKVKER